jgi:hypothetical protein
MRNLVQIIIFLIFYKVYFTYFNKNTSLIIPSLTYKIPLIRPSKKLVTTHSRIPKIICTTYATKSINVLMKPHLVDLLKNNTEYKFLFFCDETSRSYILQNLGTRALQAYDKLVPGAYKADFFRYCFLYCSGGVYIDINKKLLVPLRDIIDDNIDLFCCIDINETLPFLDLILGKKFRIFQAFMAASPRHPLLEGCIEKCIENIENNYYGDCPLDPTGPRMVGRLFENRYHSLKLCKPGVYEVGGEYVKICKLRIGGIGGPYIYDDRKKICKIYPIPKKVMKELTYSDTKTPRYGELWSSRSIYK